MKKVFSILFAAGVFALVACGSGAEQNKTEATSTDSVASATPATADTAATTAETPATGDTTAH